MRLISLSFFLCVLVLLSGGIESYGQSTYELDPKIKPDSISQTNRRLPWLAAGGLVAYTGGLVLLNEAWYKDTPRTSFHWFNDAKEWKQLDKAGHFWSAFHLSRLGHDALKNTGVSENKALWIGGSLGFALLNPIEYLDGRSPAYGASISDIGANAAGSLFLIGQNLAWNELRVWPKYSFHQTKYAALRPNTLGNGLVQEMLKDYNGHTYWLSVDVAKFLPATSKYPKWLNLALGYSADEMVYHDTDANRALGLNAYRQYYLSIDLNWQAIPSRSRFLKGAFYVLSAFKFPAPALEYSRRNGWQTHGFYF